MSSDLYPEDQFGLGAMPSPPDPKDFAFSAQVTPASLARRLVLNGMGNVLNQGSLPQCVAYTAAGMKMWQEKRDAAGLPVYDTAAFYRDLKRNDGIPGAGSDSRTSMKVLRNIGYPEKGKPGSEKRNLIATYWAVPTTVAAIKNAIATTGPVAVGGVWYGSFFKPVRGILQKPSAGVVGGHAVLIFGWDDDTADGSFLIRNSWGEYAGSVNGNFYAPYSFYVPTLWEAWVSTDLKGN